MEDQKHMPIDNALAVVVNNNKPRKKKTPPQQNLEMFQSPTNSIQTLLPTPSQKGQKGSKRSLVKDNNQVSPLLFQPDSSNDYRALRRKYLLLEEESFGLGSELKEVEDDIKTLEEEKLSLLDELVVLEGLIDPSDVSPPQGVRML